MYPYSYPSVNVGIETRTINCGPNDAIHLACALSAGCDVLIAWDRPVASVTHDKIRIEEPSIYEKDMLPAIEIATPEEIAEYERKIKSKTTTV